MKNWKEIVWLLIFFPVGIFMMYKNTDWSKRTKAIVSSLVGVLALVIIVGGIILESLFISGTLVLLAGVISTIFSFIKKRDYRPSIAILFTGFLLFGFSTQQISVRIEQQLAIEEQMRIEEEIRLEEERQQQLLDNAILAVAGAEKESTRENYDFALEQFNLLGDKDADLQQRLEVLDELITGEEQLEEAIDLVLLAENKMDRATYRDAYLKVSRLKDEHTDLFDRLKIVDTTLSKQEKIKEAKDLIVTAEKKQDRTNYDAAVKAVNLLDEEQPELTARLAKVEEVVIVKERAIEAANSAIAVAEQSKSRYDYEQAAILVSALPDKNTSFTNRLKVVEEDVEAEEARVAEEQRIAAEAAEAAAAEAARVAEEQAAIAAAEAEATAAAAQQNSPPASTGELFVDEYGQGTIKGSVNGIYHTPYSRYYSRTKNVVQWFKTVQEAESAGYRAPKQ